MADAEEYADEKGFNKKPIDETKDCQFLSSLYQVSEFHDLQ